MQNIKIFSLHKFIVWRYIYASLFIALSTPFLFGNNMEVAMQPAFILIVFGAIPSIIYIVMSKVGWTYANTFAYVYDTFLVIGTLILLVVLPNYFAFIFLAPLIGYIVEWFYFSFCWILSRQRDKRRQMYK